MASNQAAYLDEAGARMSIRDSPMPQADANGIVIKNKALAINPVDWKIQDHGIFVKKFPIVLGCDVAGEVIEVGKDVKRLKKGDRVFAYVSDAQIQESRDAVLTWCRQTHEQSRDTEARGRRICHVYPHTCCDGGNHSLKILL